MTFEVLHWLGAIGDGTLIEKDNMLGYPFNVQRQKGNWSFKIFGTNLFFAFENMMFGYKSIVYFEGLFYIKILLRILGMEML